MSDEPKVECMTLLGEYSCDLCPTKCVMAHLNRFKTVLCRMCEDCYVREHLATEYEVWRGNYIESIDGSETGDPLHEITVKFDPVGVS